MSQDIVKWADDAMYEAQPMKQGEKRGPQVYLLSATPDPLGAIAAAMRMFRGDVPYDLADVTDDERRWAWEESIKGHLKAPWEMVDFQFLLEGVSRSFTHQLVRQRTAVYAQESQRFAVKNGMKKEAIIPASIRGNEQAEKIFDDTLDWIQNAYDALVNAGIPAEDARALLPHATATRVIYKTTLRGLLTVAGDRLCTQAQFEWRAVFLGIIKAIKNHKGRNYHVGRQIIHSDWQWELIAQPMAQTFAPVCYKMGRCPFSSELDRGCTIRDRVERLAAKGVPSDEWVYGFGDQYGKEVQGINPEEWMSDPTAGITTEDNRRPE